MVTVETLTPDMVVKLRTQVVEEIRALELLLDRCNACMRYPVGDPRVDSDGLTALRARIDAAINAREEGK
jgi:hypothetical protein